MRGRVAATSVVGLMMLCAGVLRAQDVRVTNVSTYAGERRWEWEVFVTAPPAVLEKIKCVEYMLHPTFPEPLQIVCERGTNGRRPFPLKGSGWGEFQITATVTFADRPSQVIKHWLDLVEASATPCAVLASRQLREEDVWRLPDPHRPLYIYMEDIPRSRPAELIVFNTRNGVDEATFEWNDIDDHLRAARTGAQQLRDGEYVRLRPVSQTIATVRRLNGSPLRLFVTSASRGIATVNICRS